MAEKLPRMVMPDLDRRLRAAVKLSAVRKQCKQEGTSFRDWVEAHSPYAYGTAVRLARAGDRTDPLARLQDIRIRNSLASKRFRAKTRKVEVDTSSLVTCKAIFNRMTKLNKLAFLEWARQQEGKL